MDRAAAPTTRRRRGGRGRRGGQTTQSGAPQAAAQSQAEQASVVEPAAGQSPAGRSSLGRSPVSQSSAPSSPADAGLAPREDERREEARRDLPRPTPRPSADVSAFAALGLTPELLAGVASVGYERPTPIQEQAIPRVLAGRDVVGCAQTGTGKTAAFVLPILQLMEGKPAGGAASDGGGRAVAPHALVVTPTRELAGQIEEVGHALAEQTGRRVVAVYGGVGYEPQAKKVHRGVDLLVATPGRLLDMIQRGDVTLSQVSMLVLDEADRMLDMGFWPDVRRILHKLPPRRQNMFFSATMGKQVLSVIEDTLNKPVFIELGGRAVPVETIEQRVLPVTNDQKLDLLVEYFRHHEPDRTLIFTRTRHRAERLARTLNRKGVTCAPIHGDRTQGQRQEALDGFKSGRIKVLVATDVVARGIDVEGISHVINYDIPTNPEDYVHRIGRTARAGASGIAVSLLTEDEVHELKAIERLIGTTLERHDLPHFEYEKRDIPESHLVPRKPGKLLYNGGARRSAQRGIRRKPPRRSAG
jgi:ATP-dependent RNA helicase RhlE